MSKLISVIIKTFDNLLTLNNENITIIFDKNNKIWFSLRDLYKALDYKDIKKEIKRIDIDNKHLTTYGKIYINSVKHKTLHPQMVMIDESGMYIVLNNSTKPLAKEFRNKLISFI